VYLNNYIAIYNYNIVVFCVVLLLIIRHPDNVSMPINSSFVLSCEATGAGNLTYQWRKDGELLSSQNDGDYLIDTANLKDVGNYFCEVINYRGELVKSLPATVTVYGM